MLLFKDGVWQKGKTIFDVVGDLKENDVILKGANAVNIEQDARPFSSSASMPQAGTAGASLRPLITAGVCV